MQFPPLAMGEGAKKEKKEERKKKGLTSDLENLEAGLVAEAEIPDDHMIRPKAESHVTRRKARLG